MAKVADFSLLEQKLNIASSLIEELTIDDCDVFLPDATVESTTTTIATVGEPNNEVFATDTLKTDFAMIRQNVMKLIATGQRIVESASMIDVSDMTPQYLKSMSELQQTLGNNLKLLVELYSQVANIEKTRDRSKDKKQQAEVPSLVNQGSITNNNNLVFTGDTSELLEIIKQNQKQIT
jgi:hypothetical protein